MFQAQLYTILELCRAFDRIFKEHLDGGYVSHIASSLNSLFFPCTSFHGSDAHRSALTHIMVNFRSIFMSLYLALFSHIESQMRSIQVGFRIF